MLLYSSPYQDGVLTNIINLNSPKTHLQFKNSPGNIKGNGITNISFTENGNHLIVSERRSNMVFIYDLRYPREVWTVLVGRKADTNQKLGVTYCPSYGSGNSRMDNVVVAGGTDGVVRVWTPFESYKEEEEGYLTPNRKFVAARDPVTAVAVHPCGEVLATGSGQRKAVNLQEETESESESEEEEEEEEEKKEAVEERKRSWASGVESEFDAGDPEEDMVGAAAKLTGDGVWDNGVRVWVL